MGMIISYLQQYASILKLSLKGVSKDSNYSLKEFLDICNINNIQKLKPSSVKICCGNQSADMDSVVSALTYTYLNYVKTSQIILPVLNMPKEDLKLRKDIFNLLLKYGIRVDNDEKNTLIFMQDIKNLKRRIGKDFVVDAILVDHNEPQGLGIDCIDRVIGVIDHHEDTKTYDENIIKSLNNPLIIKTCGSCSSLVTNYWYPQFGSIYSLPEEIVKLSMAAVLLDTSNFKSKVEEDDLEALKKYKNYFVNNKNIEDKILNPFYKSLKKDKSDIDGFDMYDLLRKDFKLFEFHGYKIGMSSLGSSIESYIQKFGSDNINKACNKYIRLNSMDILLLLTSYSDESKTHKRQVVPYSIKSNDLQNRLIERITEELELAKVNSISDFEAFDQQKSRASRKQIAPIVEKALNSL
ncbi:uncharacterized protein HGUI_02008 [Hanseniaspora guilliermondii]|uniref:DHHA2 domain-containing protein n=1 Tax=Hanseniaspora guilliermondii TaxID=56406 RepID=A0A1L0B082_9ASCO|nr:uncharacterized protein HGUI_02008 [Hanseniaspora guilliermondii]